MDSKTLRKHTGKPLSTETNLGKQFRIQRLGYLLSCVFLIFWFVFYQEKMNQEVDKRQPISNSTQHKRYAYA